MRRRSGLAQCVRMECRRLLCGEHVVAEPSIGAGSVGPESIDVLSVPAYSSRPGAPRSLYLDFNGRPFNEAWGPSFGSLGGKDVPATPAYDSDGDTDSFSQAELAEIEIIYKVVAEKYSIFDLNVTTVKPDLSYDNGSVVIGGDLSWNPGATGVAWRQSFNSSNNVAYAMAGRDPEAIGRTAAHEAGHMLGLHHQSTAQYEYAPGFIMGSGDRWASSAVDGTYATDRAWTDNSIDSHGNQADVEVIVRSGYVGYNVPAEHVNGFGLVADDHGNSTAAATSIAMNSLFGVRTGSVSGVIGRSDIDFFTVDHQGGAFRMELLAAEHRAMLNPRLFLRTSAGALIANLDSNGASDGVGEVFNASNLDAGIYVLSVVANDAAYGNVGQYTLNIRAGSTGATANDSLATATTFGRFGQTDSSSAALGFSGTVTHADSLLSNDQFDYFKVRVPLDAHQFRVELSGMSISSQLGIIHDADNDRTLDGGELVYAGVAGTATQTFARSNLAAGETYFIRVQRTATGNTNYTLKVNLDLADHLRPARALASPQRGRTFVHDAITAFGSDTIDTYRVTPERTGLLALRMYSLTANLDLRLGTDTDNDGVLDVAEVQATSLNGFNTSEQITNFAVTAGQALLVEVRGNNAGLTSNYTLEVIADYAFGDNAGGTLVNARSLVGQGSGTLVDYIDNSLDNYDVYRVSGIGTLTVKLAMLESSGLQHRIEIVRDIDGDNVVDANEIGATGFGQISGTINSIQNNAYIRVSVVDSEVPSDGNYRLTFVQPGTVTGSSFASPTVLSPTSTPASTNGFLGFDVDDAAITDLSDYYRVTIGARTRLDLSVNHAQVGIQVLIPGATEDVSQRIAGLGNFAGVDSSISVNLDPGTYLVRTYLFVPEAQTDPIAAPYQLTFSTGAVLDTDSPDVVATAFHYDRWPQSVSFKFDQNLSVSPVAQRLQIEDLDSEGTQTYEASDVFYSPEDFTATFAIDDGATDLGILPDGRYRATLLANSVRDESGNPLTTAVSFEFHVLAGDFNRDARVNFGDLLILAQNYGQDDRLFSQGDANYDGQVNFGDLLMLAQRYNTGLPAAPVAAATPGGGGAVAAAVGRSAPARREDVADDVLA